MYDDTPMHPTRHPAQLPPGATPPTTDDPTARGLLCGAQRRPGQVQQDRDNGDPTPWPWCLNAAGKGTRHKGEGRCKDHGGNSPAQIRSIQLRYADAQEGALATFIRAMTADDATWTQKLRAAENLADRGGNPRRSEVDEVSARELLRERLLAMLDTPDDDEEVGDDG